MDYIFQGFKEAFNLLIHFDKEIYGVILLSLFVSLSATLLASTIFIPLGVYLGLKEFKGKKIVSRLLYTLMSTPSVVVGLVVAIFLSRRGILGFLELLYTPSAMVIAQTILVTPLLLSLTYNLAKTRGKIIEKTGMTLGATPLQRVFLVIRELRLDLFVTMIVAFSRAISEVGAVMIVGGNIKGHTAVITTSIVRYNSMGDYSMAIAFGIVLLLIALITNSLISIYYEK